VCRLPLFCKTVGEGWREGKKAPGMQAETHVERSACAHTHTHTHTAQMYISLMVTAQRGKTSNPFGSRKMEKEE